MIRKFLIFSLISISICGQSLLGQVDLAHLDQYIADAQQAWDIPGLSVAIVHEGEIVYEKGHGVLEAGKDAPVDENTLYAIASNTKGFIGTALSMLVDEGKLRWDDKVIEHLPYFALYDAYTSQNTTVEDLLCHRVGLGTFSGDVIWYKSNYSAEEVIKRVRFVPQAYNFRSGYGYSNLMFITAGEVIKAVSGRTWAQFVEERIFAPIGMDRSVTSVSQLARRGNVASPHKPVEGENQPIAFAPWNNSGAAGGIIASVHDMALWMNMHLNGGIVNEDTLYSSAAQQQMWHPHNTMRVSDWYKRNYPSTNFRGYGMGWSLSDYGGHKVVAHGGGYDGMYSRVLMIPGAKLGIVVLTNTMKGISTNLCNYIVDHFLMMPDAKDWCAEGLKSQERGDKWRADRVQKRVAARVSETVPRVDVSAFTGTYFADMYGPITISQQGDKLRMEIKNAPALNADLTHWHYETYEINWDETHAWFGFGTLRFELDNNNKVIGAAFDVPNDDIFFEEIELVKIK